MDSVLTETKAAGNAAEAEETKTQTAAAQETVLAEGKAVAPEKEQPQPQKEAAAEEAKPEAKVVKEPSKRKLAEGAPEKYSFTPPEGMTFDTQLLSKFEKALREANVSQKGADMLLSLGAELHSSSREAIVKAFQERADAWRAEAEADPEIGGDKLPETIASIRSYLRDENVLGEGGAHDLIQVLNETGLGNHKGLLKALAIGARMNSEDVAALGHQVSPQTKFAQSIYDKSNLR